MDLAGLLSILEKQALWFSKVAFLNDPSEGILPAKLVRFRDEIDEDGQFSINGNDLMNANDLIFKGRSGVFVNCWHHSDSESAAMWAVYASTRGLAVKTTVGRLCRSLEIADRHVKIDPISYLDYETPDPSLVKMPWLMKRQAFAYEHEVRAWIYGYEGHPEEQPYGALLKVDPEQLIERLYLAPQADPWLSDVVSSVLKRYGVKADVVRSRLYDEPKVNLPSWARPKVNAIVSPETGPRE
jgi:hypothetical protein